MPKTLNQNQVFFAEMFILTIYTSKVHKTLCDFSGTASVNCS